MIKSYCDVCGIEGEELKIHLKPRIYRCNKCGLKWADKNTIVNKTNVNYKDAVENLNELRKINYKKILKGIEKNIGINKKGFEVGSALGLFLEEAEKNGYQMRGIEPMEESYTIAKSKGLSVDRGFFPEGITTTMKYDFIIFNDVFEHIPNIASCVDACSELLIKEGILVINLPVSNGILYKIAALLDKLGISGSLERMWQFKTESPHLYYFNKKSLNKLLFNKGYCLCEEIKMKTFLIKGLTKRVQAVEVGAAKASFMSIALMLAYPIIALAPKDTCCYIFKRV